MAEQITFENETHWRLVDIQRIVRLAMAHADADMSEPRIVRVLYTKKPRKTKKTGTKRRKPNGNVTNPSVANVNFRSASMMKGDLRVGGRKLQTEVVIYLPRRGTKDPHPVAMVALAANAAVAGKVDEDATLLPFSDVYFIVNYLAYQFAHEAGRLYEDEDGEIEKRWKGLRSYFRETTPPGWGDASKLFIAKYKDALKDATYLDFVKKKETAIKREQTTIERLEKEIKSAQRKLRDARKRKKSAEKAIKDATERRTTCSQ